jgi:hypothetical protein
MALTMPTYYTYKDNVPLKPGQTLGFTPGRGYYAAGTPTPTKAPPTSAVEVQSDAASGGGYAKRATTQPKAATTTPKAAATPKAPAGRSPVKPAPATSALKPPTTSSTPPGKPSHRPTVTTLKPATTALASAFPSDAASSDGYGTRYYTYRWQVKLQPGQTLAFARGRGYYASGPASRPQLTFSISRLPSSSGGGVPTGDRQPQRPKGITSLQQGTRQLAGIPGIGDVWSSSLSPAWHLVVSIPSEIRHVMLHGSTKALHQAKGIVENAGKFLGRSIVQQVKMQLDPTGLGVKFGTDVARFAKEDPATTAAIASTLAIVAPPPLDIALGILAISTGSDASLQALKKGDYVEASLDIAAIVTGSASLGARFSEVAADISHAAAANRANSLADAIDHSDPADMPALTEEQSKALAKIVNTLATSRRRAAALRTIAQREELRTAIISIIAEPHVDPPVHH